jgi:hypothetical protein
MFEWITIAYLGRTGDFVEKYRPQLKRNGWYSLERTPNVPVPKYKIETDGLYLTHAGSSVTGRIYLASALGLEQPPRNYAQLCQALVDLQGLLGLDLDGYSDITGYGIAWYLESGIRPEVLHPYFGRKPRWTQHRISGDYGQHIEYRTALQSRKLTIKDATVFVQDGGPYTVQVMLEIGNGANLQLHDLFDPEVYRELAKTLHSEYRGIKKIPDRFFDIERLPKMSGEVNTFFASGFIAEVMSLELLDELLVSAKQRGEKLGAMDDFRKKFKGLEKKLFEIGSFKDSEVRLKFDEQIRCEYERQCTSAEEEAPKIQTTTLPEF